MTLNKNNFKIVEEYYYKNLSGEHEDRTPFDYYGDILNKREQIELLNKAKGADNE